MAKVTRSTRGAQFMAQREKFNGEKFTAFEVEVKVSNGRAERLAMKQRLAEAKALLNSPKQPVTAGFVEVESNLQFAFAV
jgi:hypothetical protein